MNKNKIDIVKLVIYLENRKNEYLKQKVHKSVTLVIGEINEIIKKISENKFN